MTQPTTGDSRVWFGDAADAYAAGLRDGAAAETARIRQALTERQAVLAFVATSRQVVAVLMKDIEYVLAGDTDGTDLTGETS